ncbi:MAG: serine/threonine protein kinase [Chloroflexi bacterium]|nr:MAG: serine/threonine protein kinase [Chloroflexota bacterium]
MSGQEAFLEPGTVLAGRYRLVSAGVMEDVGAVHEAYDTVDDRPVTVLALSPGRLPGSEALRRLVDLQVTVAGLGQPGLVPYEHAGIMAGRPYLVRPTLPHQSLAQILARGAPLETRTALEIALRVCETLAPLHRAGLVHGSLSPYSVLAGEETSPGALGPEWTVSLVDIGLLPALHSREAPGRRAWGRSPYFSPEQAAGSEARAWSDVYVVASLLYAMLAGRPPFRGADPELGALQHERQEPPSLEILVPGLSPRLAEVLDKALDKEPANRYRNAGQMAHILRGQWAETLRGDVRAAPAQPPGRERILVPAPPAQFEEAAPPVRQTFLVQEEEKEPAMANCLTVLLLILALVAVLGLIPLWRTLYRRYTTPPALPTPSLEGWLEPGELPAGYGLQTGSGRHSVPVGQILTCEAEPAVPPARFPARAGLFAPPVAVSALLEPECEVPAPARNWGPGLFSDIIRCCPSVYRAVWSQDYGFFQQLGLL